MKNLSILAAGLSTLVIAFPAAAGSPPQREIARLKREVAALKARVKRLKEENTALTNAYGMSIRRKDAVVRRVAALDPCPITHPNGSTPPGSTFGAEFHGNGALWVGVWKSNVVVDVPQTDGSIDAKFGWWRQVRGKLRIEGRRLDAPAPPLTANVPDGYGDTGFQAGGIVFPTEGCWEVTGRVGETSLTFVTLVLAA